MAGRSKKSEKALLEAEMMSDAAAHMPNAADLTQLSKLVNSAAQCNRQIAVLEEKLKEAKENLKTLTEQDIPDLMMNIGMTEVRTKEGNVVTIRNMVACSITDETRDEALGWLRSNGHDGIIKSTVVAEFGRGMDAMRAKIIKRLAELNIPAQAKETVHPQTLKAFVKETLEEGVPIPTGPFHIYQYRQAVIKSQA